MNGYFTNQVFLYVYPVPFSKEKKIKMNEAYLKLVSIVIVILEISIINLCFFFSSNFI